MLPRGPVYPGALGMPLSGVFHLEGRSLRVPVLAPRCSPGGADTCGMPVGAPPLHEMVILGRMVSEDEDGMPVEKKRAGTPLGNSWAVPAGVLEPPQHAIRDERPVEGPTVSLRLLRPPGYLLSGIRTSSATHPATTRDTWLPSRGAVVIVPLGQSGNSWESVLKEVLELPSQLPVAVPGRAYWVPNVIAISGHGGEQVHPPSGFWELRQQRLSVTCLHDQDQLLSAEQLAIHPTATMIVQR